MLNEKQQILLLKRANTDFGNDLWCLPGGKVDLGLTTSEAIIKEIKAETNLDCERCVFLFYHDFGLDPTSNTQFITFYFKCDGNIVLNSESCDYAWVSYESLNNYEIEFKNDVAIHEFWKSINEI